MKLELDLNNLDRETLIQIIKNQQGMLGRYPLGTKKATPIFGQQVKEYFGTQTKLAQLLGVSKGCLSKWIQGEKIPEHRKQHITGLSGGQIKFYNVGEVI